MDVNSKIRAIIIVTLATFVAFYLGITAATAQFEAIAWIVGVSGFIICLLLGRRIWLLIPFLGSLQLTLMIPGRPTSMLLAQCIVVVFCGLLFLLRKLPFRLHFTELEFWMALLVGCLIQVYLRNPVGINLLGGDVVGGRPYIIFSITFVATLILCGLRVPAAELRTAMILSILGGVLNFCIGLIGWFVPSLDYWFSGFYESQRDRNESIDEARATRVEMTRGIAHTLALTTASHVNPLRACFSLRWAPLVALSLAFAAVSGYRNVIASVGLSYLVGLLYRGNLLSVMATGVLAALGMMFLSIGNLIHPYPPNVQRSLSFLPGSWDARYTQDAQNSTDWRVEIWKEVLLTDRWIQNKWLGDGLGFSARELAMQRSMLENRGRGRLGVSGFDTHREAILSNGDYHSGPVSAIRTIGYIGLLVMALAQIRLVVHAHRQVMRCKGTEWFSVALFFCIPIIWSPVFFWFVFGGFLMDGPAILLGAGMLRLLENNLPLPVYATARRMPFALATRPSHTAIPAAGEGGSPVFR